MVIEGTGELRLDTREGLVILLGYSVDEELDIAPCLLTYIGSRLSGSHQTPAAYWLRLDHDLRFDLKADPSAADNVRSSRVHAFRVERYHLARRAPRKELAKVVRLSGSERGPASLLRFSPEPTGRLDNQQLRRNQALQQAVQERFRDGELTGFELLQAVEARLVERIP